MLELKEISYFFRPFKILRGLLMRRRNGHYSLGSVRKPVIIHRTVTFFYPHNIEISQYVRIGARCHLDGEGGLDIGDGSVLAPNCTILTSSHIYAQDEYLPFNNDDRLARVVIGRGCWLCWGCLIMPGVSIGDGAVVAAGAVVTKDVNKGEVVGGNPAKIITVRESGKLEEMIAEERYYQKAVLVNGLRRRPRR